MFVSVLIPLYNGIEFLDESISSVKYQTHKNWEIIIGINGHPENSNIYLQAKQYQNNKIRVLEFLSTKGKSQTLNEMIKYSKYDIICLLDVDDKWLPSKLEEQIKSGVSEKEIRNVVDFISSQSTYEIHKDITNEIIDKKHELNF